MGRPNRDRILVVDDEQEILVAFEDVLEEEFDVVTTREPARALELARKDSGISVVIADLNMAGLAGDELLQQLHQLSRATRILLTGRLDPAALTRAVNEGRIFAVLTKPWDREDLLLKVRQAAELYRITRELDGERELVRTLMSGTPDAIYLKDLEHRFTRVNDTVVKLFGFDDPGPVLGKHRSELPFADASAAEVEAYEDELLLTGEPRRDILHRQPTATGARWFSTTKAPLRSASGRIEGVVCISRDVTERVEAEAALRTSEERLRLAFRAAGAGLFDWNLETGEVLYEESHNGPPSQDEPLASATFADIEQRIHPSDRPLLQEAVRAHLERREPFHAIEVRALNESGDYRWFRLSAQAAWDAAGKPVRFVGSSVDIDDLRKAEARLHQAQKLEAIGQLAAGIAHEINTPAQYVGDNIAFVERAFGGLENVLEAYRKLADVTRAGAPADEALAELDASLEACKLDYLLAEIPSALKQSLEGVAQVGSIVRAMKEFSHPGGKERQLTDLRPIIESACTVSRNEWKYVAELELELAEDVPEIPVLRNELSQVLLNLIVNAAHAMAEVADTTDTKGRLKIATRALGEQVEIRVSDTGTGIPPAVQARVFEPFFTTKVVGRGTGQGLALAHAIVVDQHHGSIHFETEVGKGTTFVIRLPVQEAESEDEECTRASA